MKHWLAVLAGLTLIVMGTGAAGTNVAFLFGIGLFGYNLAVLVSLALRDLIERLAGVFEAWGELSVPNRQTPSHWYGRPREPKKVKIVHMDKTYQNAPCWFGRPEQYRQMQAGTPAFKVLAPALLRSQKRRSINQPQTGQSLLEYALILALVFVVAVVGLALFGEGLAELFENTIGALRETFLG